ncbi:MAG: winged helix-turn-helix transcriptional regulator [Proteobacteria bacterium]|nr:winged helix-turn-helix transcriptional regulator [Pseudomonadota bacterium]
MPKTDTDSPDLDNEAKITLGLLNMVGEDSGTSQRSMASDLGIALGLTNAYLKRCVKKGLIKVSQVPANRYAYYLTPKGFAEKSRLTTEYLSQSFNLFRHARAEGADLLSHCHTRGWNRVALYGLGDLAEIMTLSARDYPIELIGVIDHEPEAGEFSSLPVLAAMPGPEDVDAVIICDISEPQVAYDETCANFPVERVLAPKFLNISKGNGRTLKGKRGAR